MRIKNIQFKRIKGFTGSFNEAVNKIKTENSGIDLQPGEPLICSYLSGSDQENFFLAIGTVCRGERTFKVFPAFTDLTDFENFVKSKCGGGATFDLETAVSSNDSDIEVKKKDDGKYTLKIKDGIFSWEMLSEKDNQ